MTMTTEEIQALQALAEKATAGPWTYLVINGLDTVVDARMVMIVGDGDTSEPDRAVDYVNLNRNEYRFIAASREAVPALCAEVLALRAEVDRLNAAIRTQANAVRTLQACEETQINQLRKGERDAYRAVQTLDSERDANAILTAENDALRAEVARLREAVTA